MSQTISTQPLQTIFFILPLKEMRTCRAVCRDWLQTADQPEFLQKWLEINGFPIPDPVLATRLFSESRIFTNLSQVSSILQTFMDASKDLTESQSMRLSIFYGLSPEDEALHVDIGQIMGPNYQEIDFLSEDRSHYLLLLSEEEQNQFNGPARISYTYQDCHVFSQTPAIPEFLNLIFSRRDDSTPTFFDRVRRNEVKWVNIGIAAAAVTIAGLALYRLTKK